MSSSYFSIVLWRSRSTWSIAIRRFVIRIYFVIRYSDFDIRVASEPTASITITSKSTSEHEEIGDYLCESVAIRG